MTTDSAIAWISTNYSPGDFGISEEQLLEKLSQDRYYNYEDEIQIINNQLLNDNPTFSSKLLNRISKESYKRLFINEDLGRLQTEANVKRKFDSGERLSRSEKDILLEVWNINPDF